MSVAKGEAQDRENVRAHMTAMVALIMSRKPKRPHWQKYYSQRAGVARSSAARNRSKDPARRIQIAALLKALQTLAIYLNNAPTKESGANRPRIYDFWRRAPRAIGIFVKATLALVIATVLFSDVFEKKAVIIEPFLTNAEFQSRYGEQVVADLFVHNLSIMIGEAASIRKTQGFQVPLATKLPEMEVPGTKISAKTILRYVQEFGPFRYIRKIFGLNPIRVTGAAMLQGERIVINLRITRDEDDGARIEAKTFTGSLENINSVFSDASEYILAHVEPYLFASYLYQKKRTEEALAQIQICLFYDSSENSHLALTLWGMILIDQNSYDEAINKLKEATKEEKLGEKNRELAAAYNNWGLALLYEHRIDDAITKFEEAMMHDPNYALAYNNYGKALLDKKENKRAIEALKKSLTLDPNLAVAYYNLARALAKEGPYDSIALYEAAIKIDPGFVDAYSNVGLLLTERGMHDEAIKKLKKAIELDPESARAHSNLALVWLNKQDYQKAKVEYHLAIKLFAKQMSTNQGDENFIESYASTHNNLGWVYELTFDYASAESNYDSAIRINPKYYLAYIGKGDALRKAGRFSEALGAYDIVLQQPESDEGIRGDAYEGKGKVYLERCRNCAPPKRRNDVEQAVCMFDQAKQRNPNSEDVRSELAEAREDWGKLLLKPR